MSAPVAAFGSTISVTGASTPDTGEACAHVSGSGSSRLYQVTSTAKRVWDPSVAVTVKDGGTPVTAADYVFNSLAGTIQFAGYTPSGSITLDGSYFPIYPAALANKFDLDIKATLVDTSNFDGSGAVERYPTLSDFSGTLHVLEDMLTVLDSGSLTWESIMAAKTPVVIAVHFGTSAAPLWFKGWAILESTKVSAAIAGVLEGDVGFKGSVTSGVYNMYFGP